jgi:N-acylneuraminate cytidylyltransferase
MRIAIIPARGGSKRIAKKNIKFFLDLPLIAYAINGAKESKLFEHIIVSTDDQEIADVALDYGALVPWLRDSDLSDDYATTVSVMSDAVTRISSSVTGITEVCCIYPATPLLNPEYFSKGLETLISGKWDYVISALPVRARPEKLFSLDATKAIKLDNSEAENWRSQDLRSAFVDAGQFYWGTKQSWQRGLPIFSSRSTIFELPMYSTVDIDTLEDWEFAEQLYRIRLGE